MPYATTDDGVRLYFEETGSGCPVILVHEFAGDLRSYEPQMRHFGKRYRAIAFNARGFPPSDVPKHVASYSQARAADDILTVLDHTGERQAHIVGLSMGGFATLHFGLRHPQRARSLCIGGCGYGAELDKCEAFRAEADAIASIIRTDGMPAFAERYAYGPTRVQYENKDPRGHAEFKRMLPSILPSDRPTRSRACKRSGRRFIRWSRKCGASMCRRSSSPVMRTGRACRPASS